jgi:hypothetical protein
MAHKRSGQLTVLAEWARHLRPRLRRAFWKGERRAERALVLEETADLAPRVEREETDPQTKELEQD